MTLTMFMFAVVREERGGRRWVDTATVHLLREEAMRVAEADDAAMPGWAFENPIAGVGRFRLEMVEFQSFRGKV